MSVGIDQSPKNRQVIFKINNIDKRMRSELYNAISTVGQIHVNKIKQLMREPKTGRIYTIHGKKHQASAPGEAPAILSGSLDRSTQYIASGNLDVEFGYKSRRSKAPYGRFLELGTTNIKIRPGVNRAVQKMRTQSRNEILSAINKAIK